MLVIIMAGKDSQEEEMGGDERKVREEIQDQWTPNEEQHLRKEEPKDIERAPSNPPMPPT